jgi:hypothetical protein
MVLAVVHHLEIAIARLVQLDYAQEFNTQENRAILIYHFYLQKREENLRNSQELTQEGEVVRVNRDQRSSSPHCGT